MYTQWPLLSYQMILQQIDKDMTWNNGIFQAHKFIIPNDNYPR